MAGIKKRQSSRALTCRLTPQMPETIRAGPDDAKRRGTPLRTPLRTPPTTGRKGPKGLSQYLPSSMVCIHKRPEAELGLNQRALTWDAGILSNAFTAVPNAHSYQ